MAISPNVINDVVAHYCFSDLFQQRYRQANYTAREELSNLNAKLQENIIGIGVVQIFRREAFNSELFRDNNQKYVNQMDKTIFYDSAVSATLEWIALVAIAGVLWLGGLLVLDKTLAFGQLSEFILFSQRLFVPLRQFADKFTAIQAGLPPLNESPIFSINPLKSATQKILPGTAFSQK
jgi:ATP-binding cassette subfamily B multidrug efflux pump